MVKLSAQLLHSAVSWCKGSTRDFDSLCLGSNPGETIFSSSEPPLSRGGFFALTRAAALRLSGTLNMSSSRVLYALIHFHLAYVFIIRM